MKERIYKYILPLVIVVQLLMLMATRFTAWPEMLAWPYLLTEGWLPYNDIAIAHTPVLIVTLSLFYKLFGVGVLQLQLFTWLVILLTTILIWKISNSLFNKRVASIAVITFALYQLYFDGNGLWFDLLLTPLFLVIFYLLERKKYISAGAFWGVSLLVKQTAVWALIPVAIQLFITGSRKLWELEKRYVPFLYGTVLVIFASVLLMYFSGVLAYFAHWAIEFGIFTLPGLSGQIDLPSINEIIKAKFVFIPLITLVLIRKDVLSKNIFAWAIFSSWGIFPRWELFHLQPALPFVAIGTALLIEKLVTNKKNIKAVKIVITLFAVIFGLLFVKFLFNNLNKPIRFYEPSVTEIVQTIKDVTGDDEIYVINYWDSLYALTDNQPAVRPLIPYIPWYLDYNDLDLFIESEFLNDFPAVVVRGQYGEGLSSYKIEGLESILIKYYTLHKTIDNVDILIRN